MKKIAPRKKISPLAKQHIAEVFMLAAVGLVILVLLLAAVLLHFFKDGKAKVALAVWKRRTLGGLEPFEEEMSSAHNEGRIIYRGTTTGRVYTTAVVDDDSVAYESGRLEPEMLNCYRPTEDDDICVPDVLGNACMSCQDTEDPPGSGCYAGDTTCANNYFASRAGGTQNPVKTYAIAEASIPLIDGYISGACVQVRNAQTLDLIMTAKTDSNGNLHIPSTLGVVVLEQVACADGSTPVDISTNTPFSGMLSSVGDASESPVISPLTSLAASATITSIKTAVASGGIADLSVINTDRASNEAKVASALGITADDLKSDFNNKTNINASKAATKIALATKMISAASGKNASASVLQSLSESILAVEEGQELDLTDESVVETVAVNSLTKIGISASEATSRARQVKAGVANVSRIIRDTDGSDPVAGITAITKLNRVVSLEANKGESGAAGLSNLNQAALQQKADDVSDDDIGDVFTSIDPLTAVVSLDKMNWYFDFNTLAGDPGTTTGADILIYDLVDPDNRPPIDFFPVGAAYGHAPSVHQYNPEDPASRGLKLAQGFGQSSYFRSGATYNHGVEHTQFWVFVHSRLGGGQRLSEARPSQSWLASHSSMMLDRDIPTLQVPSRNIKADVGNHLNHHVFEQGQIYILSAKFRANSVTIGYNRYGDYENYAEETYDNNVTNSAMVNGILHVGAQQAHEGILLSWFDIEGDVPDGTIARVRDALYEKYVEAYSAPKEFTINQANSSTNPSCKGPGWDRNTSNYPVICSNTFDAVNNFYDFEFPNTNNSFYVEFDMLATDVSWERIFSISPDNRTWGAAAHHYWMTFGSFNKPPRLGTHSYYYSRSDWLIYAQGLGLTDWVWRWQTASVGTASWLSGEAGVANPSAANDFPDYLAESDTNVRHYIWRYRFEMKDGEPLRIYWGKHDGQPVDFQNPGDNVFGPLESSQNVTLGFENGANWRWRLATNYMANGHANINNACIFYDTVAYGNLA